MKKGCLADWFIYAERIHADHTPVPVLAKNKTRTRRLWTYVRDDRPFSEQAPPAAAFFYSPDRGGEHPATHLTGWAGVMQVRRLCRPDRKSRRVVPVARFLVDDPLKTRASWSVFKAGCTGSAFRNLSKVISWHDICCHNRKAEVFRNTCKILLSEYYV